ncbi:CBS domain-containing protein [Phyllobacterium sp. LjRoot231]|uniref:CBS domain-containing protein n=1 Tax=Phyllobacterium sp. LjRoot231 TaxID=3342289 RepID=UPI003ECC4DD1
MNASDVMIRAVATVGPDTPIAEVAKLMMLNDVSAVPVVDDKGGIVGIISEADLLRREEIGTERHRPWWLEAMTPATTLAAEFAKSHGKRVDELMSKEVITATEDTPLAQIAAILERNRIKRVPIMRGSELVGIVSQANLVQALASSAMATQDGWDESRMIKQEILSRLEQQTWTDFGNRNVIVTGGNVHLWGLVGSQAERKALTALVEGVPGVTGVIDEMIAAY